MHWEVISPFLLYIHTVLDTDQLYEQWLQSQKPGWGDDTQSNSARENGKQILMPTDYAEEVVSWRNKKKEICE